MLFGSSASRGDKQRFDFDASRPTVARDGRHFDSAGVISSSSELFFGDSLSSSSSAPFGGGHVDFGQFESSLLDGFLLDDQLKKLLAAPLKQLIIIINSILGLSVDKIAKHYFSPDFWYILVGRALCIGCWTMGSRSLRRRSRRSDFSAVDRGDSRAAREASFIDFLRSLVSRTTVVKLLLILAYSQMLIQQMDNQAHLHQDLQSAALSQLPTDGSSGCCGGGGGAEKLAEQESSAHASTLHGWFNCMWTSAKSCSSSSEAGKVTTRPLIARILASLIETCSQVFDSIVMLAMSIGLKLASIHLLLHSVGAVWLARWRSPIVHRLMQSMLVQVFYISGLLMSTDDDDDFELLSAE